MMEATNLARRNREKDSVPRFKALITTPAVVPFKLPANATLGVRKTVAIVDGATVATVVGKSTRTIKAKATAANIVRSIGYFERSVTVTPATGVEVLINVGLGKWKKIAQG